MAYRQYIGARYVPLYDGTWESTKNYEPLTIVDDANGNSYTSKKDVPAGTPLNDRDYWVQTSSFSGAVEQLRRDLNTLQTGLSDAENDITALQSGLSGANYDISKLNTAIDTEKRNLYGERYFLFVSDSFGDQSNEWVRMILDSGDVDGENLSVSGIGFTVGIGGVAGQNGILQVLQAYTGDKTKVTDIVIACGLNDSTFDGAAGVTTLINAGTAVIDHINTNYNAIIHIGYIGNALDDSSVIANRTAERRMLALYAYKSMTGKNVKYLNNVEFALCGNTANFASDRLHPSTYGSIALAGAVRSALAGGFTFQYPRIPAQTGNWKLSLSDGVGILRNVADKIYTVSGGTIGATPVALDTFATAYFNVPVVLRVPLRCHLSGTGYFNAVVLLTFTGNTLTVTSAEYEGNALKTISLDNIMIDAGIEISFPTMYVN